MPRQRSGDSSPFDSFLNIFTDTIGRTAKKVMPKCHICGLNAMPFPCQACGRYACLEHAWMNAKRAEAVCDECMGAVLGDAEEAEEDVPDGYNPWAVLGVGPEDGLEGAKRAFRRKALKCHPDQGGSSAKFQELKKAFDSIVALYAQQEDGGVDG